MAAADRVSRESEWVSERTGGARNREEGILWMPVQWPWCVVSARLIITGLLCHLMLEISWIQNKSMESRFLGAAAERLASGPRAFSRSGPLPPRRHQRNLFGTFARPAPIATHCAFVIATRVWRRSGSRSAVGAFARGSSWCYCFLCALKQFTVMTKVRMYDLRNLYTN